MERLQKDENYNLNGLVFEFWIFDSKLILYRINDQAQNFMI